MPGAEIVVSGLHHRYRGGDGPLPVLRDLDLHVPAGGYTAITGASGAGKSTLLSVLGGLEAPQEGRVVVGGSDLAGLSRSALAGYRRERVGFVFQHFGLLDSLTATENVALALTLSGVAARESRRRAQALLAAVGLGHRLDHQPSRLSGGERQRVAIARALANEPELVLADEPTGNLDVDSSRLVAELLEAIHRERGCTLVVVTHDPAVASRAATIHRLVAGRLDEDEP